MIFDVRVVGFRPSSLAAPFGPEILQRVARLVDSGYEARPERALVFHVKAWDVNCPQHIQQRFTPEEMEPTLEALRARIEQLESQLREAGLEPAPEPETELIAHTID